MNVCNGWKADVNRPHVSTATVASGSPLICKPVVRGCRGDVMSEGQMAQQRGANKASEGEWRPDQVMLISFRHTRSRGTRWVEKRAKHRALKRI